MSSVNLEKSLNNLNVNVSQMASKVEEVACMFSEFSVKFSKQTEMLVEELKLLRIGVYQLGNNIRRRSQLEEESVVHVGWLCFCCSVNV